MASLSVSTLLPTYNTSSFPFSCSYGEGGHTCTMSEPSKSNITLDLSTNTATVKFVNLTIFGELEDSRN